jgi:hypothetical protein
MPYCSNTKTTSLEWHQWPALDLSIHNVVLDHTNGGIGTGRSSAISVLKAGLADAQSLQGARAVSRTLLQCLRQVEKIDDGCATQELEASILANSAYGTIMSGIAHSCTQRAIPLASNLTSQFVALAAAAITPAATDLRPPSGINAQEQVPQITSCYRGLNLYLRACIWIASFVKARWRLAMAKQDLRRSTRSTSQPYPICRLRCPHCAEPFLIMVQRQLSLFFTVPTNKVRFSQRMLPCKKPMTVHPFTSGTQTICLCQLHEDNVLQPPASIIAPRYALHHQCRRPQASSSAGLASNSSKEFMLYRVSAIVDVDHASLNLLDVCVLSPTLILHCLPHCRCSTRMICLANSNPNQRTCPVRRT